MMQQLNGHSNPQLLVAHPVAAPALGPPLASAGKELEIRRLWKTLWRRRLPFAVVLGSFIVLVGVITALQPKSYTTLVKMIVGSSSGTGNAANQTDLPILNMITALSGQQTAETYAELLQQPDVQLGVIKRLGLLGVSPDQLHAHVSIKPVTNTPVIGVAVTWPNREMSAKIANTYATVFIERQRQLLTGQAAISVNNLQDQLGPAREHLRASQVTLAAYQKRVGIADVAIQGSAQLNALAGLDARALAAETAGKQAQGQLGALRGQLAVTPATITTASNVAINPIRAQLEAQIATVTVQLNSAKQQYTDSHPTVVALSQQLEQLKREVSKQSATIGSGSASGPNPTYQLLKQQEANALATIAAASAELVNVKKQRAEMQPLISSLPDKQRRIGDLTRDVKAAETVVGALESKLHNAEIEQSTRLSDVTVTQPAVAAVATISPNLALNLGLATLIGLVLALTTVFGLEFFDDRLRTEDDIKERIGLPVLATIPQLGAGPKRDQGWVEQLTVESFFQLVTSLRYSSDHPPRTIAITSPKQGDGKSTIAINIAISMASLNAKVLVVDADLRRPTIHTKLRIGNEAGLSDVLVGVMPLMEAVRPSGRDGVWTLTSGTRAPNPVALLQSESFDRILQEARDNFDFVILDGPALGSIIDGVLLGMKADGTVLVLSASQTDGRAAQSALAKLRGVSTLNLLGVVLNQTKVEPSAFSDYYLGSGQSVSLPGAAGEKTGEKAGEKAGFAAGARDMQRS